MRSVAILSRVGYDRRVDERERAPNGRFLPVFLIDEKGRAMKIMDYREAEMRLKARRDPDLKPMEGWV